jgi:type I restriction enzyme S subunit
MSSRQVQRVGRVARTISGSGFPPEYQGRDTGDLPFVKVSDLARNSNANGIVMAANYVSYADQISLGARLVPEGSIIFPKVGAALLGNARRVTLTKCLLDNNLMAIAPREGDARYWKYALMTVDLGELSGSGPLPYVSDSQVRDLRIPFPLLDEQRRIADFLDAETTRLDQLMSSQLRMLDLLEERANGRILDLIGQSLIVNREGATIVPMRRVIKKLNRPIIPTSEIITAFRDGQVTSRTIRRSEGYTLAASTEPQGQGVDVGDIVIHGLDGFAGAIGDSEAPGNCSPVYHVCIPVDGGNPSFYGRLLRLLALSDYLALFGASARERAVDFRNWKIFGHAPIPQVEPVVQHEIGSLITKIRPLREEVKHFNERLAERRRALITAAVIGEIDVTTARGATV